MLSLKCWLQIRVTYVIGLHNQHDLIEFYGVILLGKVVSIATVAVKAILKDSAITNTFKQFQDLFMC